jgi:hypothetical protein
MQRLRSLSEAECYARCYGARDETVNVVGIDDPDAHRFASLARDEVRRIYESGLDERDQEATSEAA